MITPQEFYVQQQMLEGGPFAPMDRAIEMVLDYAQPSYCYYMSKNLRLDEWNPTKEEVYETLLRILTATLGQGHTTYQNIAGVCASKIAVKDHLDQLKIISDVIAIAAKADLIDIEHSGSGSYIMVVAKYGIEGELPQEERHQILIEKPPQIVENRHPEHGGSLILGWSKNHHDGDICLDHINRMNGIQLKLNRAFLRKYEEAPSSILETSEQKEQWATFIENSYRAYIKVVRSGNRFYLEHNYDKRGRTYAEGYHISTQGSSFKKAIIQLANAELVQGYNHERNSRK